jgi:uncharacterized protein
VIAADTNIFLYALNADAPEQEAARAFLDEQADNPDFVLCELMLVELYVLLRNPAVLRRPLDAAKAVAIVQQLRRHPTWQLIDHDPKVMDDVWKAAEQREFARGRIYDARLAFTLYQHGVTHFATRNVKHFDGFGFQSVWNPLI